MIPERYQRNIPSISEEQQLLLKEKKVAVPGCGGLGGYIIELLARIGVGHIVAIDGDVFEMSNYNRQLFSTTSNYGTPKAIVAKERVNEINPDVEVTAVHAFLTEENAGELIKGCDLIVDALDNVKSRLVLEDAAEKEGITIIHGAIHAWEMQCTVVPPGSGILHRLYMNSDSDNKNDPETKTSLAFAPCCCAAVEVCEAVKALTGRSSELKGKLFVMDMKSSFTGLLPLELF